MHQIRIQCVACHNLLVGTPELAAAWHSCPACGSDQLVFAQAVSIPNLPPALPGTPLALWKNMLGAGRGGPAGPVPAAHPAAYQPAPQTYPVTPPGVPTLPRPVLPQGAAATPPGVPRPMIAPRGKGARPRPPEVKKASKTLIMVRLLVAFGALAIAGAVTIVALLKDDPPPAPETAAETNRSSPKPSTTPKPAPAGPKENPSKIFISNSAVWSKDLAEKATALQEAEAALAMALAALYLDAEAKRTGVADDLEKAKTALADNKKLVDAAEARVATAKAARDLKLKDQSLSSQFFAVLAVFQSHDDAMVKLEAQLEQALYETETRRETMIAARDAYYGTEDAAEQDRYKKVFDDAIEDYRAAARAEEELETQYLALAEQAESALGDVMQAIGVMAKSSDPNAKTIAAAYAEYDKSFQKVLKAEAALAEAKAKVAIRVAAIDEADRVAAECAEAYRDVHAVYLELAAEASKLEAKYLADGGAHRKQAAEAARRRADNYKPQDTEARALKSDADKALATAKSEKRKAEKAVKDAEAALVDVRKADKLELAKLQKVLDKVRTAEAPKEKSRLAELKTAEDALATEQAELKRVADLRRGLERDVIAKADALEAIDYEVSSLKDLDDLALSGVPGKLETLATALGKLQGKSVITVGEANLYLDAAATIEERIGRYDENGWLATAARRNSNIKLLLQDRTEAASNAREATSVVTWSAYELVEKLMGRK